jgi:hypothetical protein
VFQLLVPTRQRAVSAPAICDRARIERLFVPVALSGTMQAPQPTVTGPGCCAHLPGVSDPASTALRVTRHEPSPRRPRPSTPPGPLARGLTCNWALPISHIRAQPEGDHHATT